MLTDAALFTSGKISLMSDVEITKPGGIAVGGVIAEFVEEVSVEIGAAEVASGDAATMLPQERRMIIRSLFAYFLSPKATRLLPLIATLSTMSVVVSLVTGG